MKKRVFNTSSHGAPTVKSLSYYIPFLMNKLTLLQKIAEAYIGETKKRFSALDYGIIKSIIESVPREWHLSKADANALIEYLTSRLKHIDDYIKLIFRRGGKIDHES